uniref:Limiting CO2-inducible protein B/C beta carbonyic anhydrase domain-containing protein n=1 Tax=Chlamydomonas euryale TaxID=1486919 RepID=A0A6U2J374_9CHLO
MAFALASSSALSAASGRVAAGAKRVVGNGVVARPVLSGAPVSSALVSGTTCVCSSGCRCACPCHGRSGAVARRAIVARAAVKNEDDLASRHECVESYFPGALGIDDFIARVEVVLSGYGFTGDNSIACTNLCRDEVTAVLKDKIESVFGSSFMTNGLGAVLTCGATGMGAGLSHSPTCNAGREKYVFFSFPHIAIDGKGEVGAITRPGRDGKSCACGALAKCLGELKAEGYEAACRVPGEHDVLDPEYSILKQRLARRLRYEKADMSTMTLEGLTAVAERTITNDLEYLIEKSLIDPKKADYAVVTGVQIHNWATKLDPRGPPSLEFVQPTKVYVVSNGVKTHLDLSKVPALSPRQLLALASPKDQDQDKFAVSQSTGSTLQEIPYEYLNQRIYGSQVSTTDFAESATAAELEPTNSWPSWQSVVRGKSNDRDAKAPTMDSVEEEDKVNTSFEVAK